MERGPGSGLDLLGMSYDNTGALTANSWRHVAFVEQPRPVGWQTAAPLAGLPTGRRPPDPAGVGGAAAPTADLPGVAPASDPAPPPGWPTAGVPRHARRARPAGDRGGARTTCAG